MFLGCGRGLLVNLLNLVNNSPVDTHMPKSQKYLGAQLKISMSQLPSQVEAVSGAGGGHWVELLGNDSRSFPLVSIWRPDLQRKP